MSLMYLQSMSMPTGLGVVCASPRALELRHTAKMPRLFFDFGDMLKFNEVGNFPYTPSIPLLYALRCDSKYKTVVQSMILMYVCRVALGRLLISC